MWERLRIRTGVDICQIAALRQAVERAPQLATELFHPAEAAYCRTLREPWPSFAARFAAKEAFAKAIDLDLLTVELDQIEVRRDASGRPRIRLDNEALRDRVRRALAGDPLDVDLSMSHDAEYAIASVAVLVVANVEEASKTDTWPW